MVFKLCGSTGSRDMYFKHMDGGSTALESLVLVVTAKNSYIYQVSKITLEGRSDGTMS